MANTPTTAKLHAQSTRKNEQYGPLGEKVTESTKAWPKMSWDAGIKAANYVGAYASRNSEFRTGRQ